MEMSKAKMSAARELIREKKYEEARHLLATVDHPTATDWLLRIDSILAAQSSTGEVKPKKTKQKTRKSRLRIVIEGVILTLGGLICLVAALPAMLPMPPLTQAHTDILATTVAQIPNWQKWRIDSGNYYVTVEDTGAGLRDREKFAQIGDSIVANNISGIRRVILIYTYQGITTFTITAQTSDIRDFVNGKISEDEFELRIKVE